MAAVAGAISVGLHAGGLIALAPPEPQTLAGGPAQLAMIGNSFEDAVAGTVTGRTEAVRMAPTAVAAPVAPVAQRATPVATAAPSPAPSAASVVAPVVPDTAPVVASATPVRTEAAETPTPETVTARDLPMARAPDADTPRPQPRIARPERPAQTASPAPQGSAAQIARAGDIRGAAQGNATRTQQGTSGQSSSDGRAAAQYPHLVNRHLSRLRRPNARFNGAAVVAFTIAGNGGLAGVSIARSSGSAEFDRLALAHVQRAAPFPPPPAGAQRSFNVSVQGR